MDCGNGNIDYLEVCDGSNLNGMDCPSLRDSFVGGNLRCDDACLSFDLSGCLEDFCGDGIIDRYAGTSDEQCDGTNLGSTTCEDLGFEGGTLACKSNCLFDTNGCIPGLPPPECGNGILEVGEECDPQDANGIEGTSCSVYDSSRFISGTVHCASDCKIDLRECQGAVDFCGDGRVTRGEQCDDVLGIEDMQCTDFGDFTGGTLECVDCKYDTSGCTGPVEGLCGDGTVAVGEQCEDALGVGDMRCHDFDDFTDGSLRCIECEYDTTNCIEPSGDYCGDGVINDAEVCDSGDLGDVGGCEDLEGFTGGVLDCGDDCHYDTSLCIPEIPPSECGNDILESGEHCDGDVGGATCQDVGNFLGGTLRCDMTAPDACTFDVGDCVKNESEPYCGDGIINGNSETCDGTTFSSSIHGCTSFPSYVGGTLKCTGCALDFSECIIGNGTGHCNNDVKDGDETDVNCGGSLCSPCENGKMCIIDADCKYNYCKSGVCSEANCFDSEKNGLETDIDCGGDCDQKCDINQGCRPDFDDCKIGLFCRPDTNPATGKCAVPSCDDGYRNGDETDVDCGDGCPTKCSIGDACRSPNDCITGFCESWICSTDPSSDTDGDGMPDKWESKFFLDPSDPTDAGKDLDGDGYSNLEEYSNNTDPSDPNDPTPKKKHTLQIIFLALGLLLMLGSAGFLVYSRKVLIPEQRAARARAVAGRRPMPQKPFHGQLLQRPGMTKGRVAPGIAPGRRPTLRRPILRGTARRAAGKRMTQRQAARKNLLRGFGREREKPALKPALKPKSGEMPGDKSGVKPRARLRGKSEAELKSSQATPRSKRPTSDAFKKLGELTKGRGKQTPIGSVGPTGSLGVGADKKNSGSALQELKDLNKKKVVGKKKEIQKQQEQDRNNKSKIQEQR